MKNGRNVLKDGSIRYHKGNRLHREDGPAYEMKYTYQTVYKWYIRGKLHRLDGPAIIMITVTRGATYTHHEYFKNGKKHRLDGPAKHEFSNLDCLSSIIHNNIYDEYFIDGKKLSKDDYNTFIRNIKINKLLNSECKTVR